MPRLLGPQLLAPRLPRFFVPLYTSALFFALASAPPLALTSSAPQAASWLTFLLFALASAPPLALTSATPQVTSWLASLHVSQHAFALVQTLLVSAQPLCSSVLFCIILVSELCFFWCSLYVPWCLLWCSASHLLRCCDLFGGVLGCGYCS